MSVSSPDRLELPASLQTQLHEFRRRVWTIKSIEAACGALFGVIVSYLAVFVLDRFIDTPNSTRVAIFLVAIIGCAIVPVYLHRWIWQNRHMEQLAKLLSRKHPSLGDQMLGVIELARNDSEQARSRALVAAAIHQVADVAAKRNLNDAVPNPRHRMWAWLAGVPTAVAIIALAMFPAAASNAWARFLAPWKPIERYTFTAIDKLPEKVVVPHGEPVTIAVPLKENSAWHPAAGTTQVGTQPVVKAELKDGKYDFQLPGQIDAVPLKLRIGDVRQDVRVEPMHRPELAGIEANIKLPAYLERTEPVHKDIRGGTVSVVNGAEVQFTATANRALAGATVDGAAVATDDKKLTSAPMPVAESRKLQFEWKDEFGLQGQEPFTVSLNAREDEAPSLATEDMPRQRIVLESETLQFKVRAQDDFGVKIVGIEWHGLDSTAVTKPAKGEQLLAAGGSDKENLELAGTFCAKTLGIEAQPLNVRIFAEDYKPSRERSYSANYVLYVLTAEQHSIWITEQLSKWHRQALEVRDREMALHATNQQLRMLSNEELDLPENRQRLDAQATAERANGRRLTSLTGAGEELVRQAMRNPEFGVGHLEKWAEMLQILKDISANRMPSVAELLKQSAKAPGENMAQAKPSVTAGQNKMPMREGPGSKPGEPQPPKPVVPTVTDAESSQNPGKKSDQPEEPSTSKPSSPSLRLPVTTVMGSGAKKPGQPSPAGEKLEEAVKVQQDLLAEFEKIADELNKVLANLEGSTLVKRLKAASRKQTVVANKLGTEIGAAFGQKNRVAAPTKKSLEEMAEVEAKSSHDLSNIMDDMQAYFDRRRMQRFKTVLDEMREQDAVGSLRQLGDDVKTEAGLSIAQAEFWSDTFDRWADDLVDPACSGKCPGCKSKASLPPSIVLEAMQILEAEVNLREETRVTEQAKKALAREQYSERAGKLRGIQDSLTKRVADLTVRIRELPEGEQEFGKEIALLGKVEMVMGEAADILGKPDTGSPAIAAETEAIELLLQSKKINPGRGGGGGSNPGGGGGGDTNDVAIALVGTGINEKEVREDRGISQATGESGVVLPEEFRAGLDQYFNRLESGSDKK
ncbi:MAG TPA: hypothetical protein VFG20_12320 [Planctomycetaceae bacterium]|nr:hypothetical protein [Planctomycetaceae bacterium]